MIAVAGISHRRTPVHRREKAAVASHALPERLRRARQQLRARECIILSTCNRTEVYFVTDRPGDTAARGVLFPDAGAPGGGDESEVYLLRGSDAANHLCEVAAGLDSLILGEHEIMAQVRSALEAARATGTVGPLLGRLFHRALRAGKRVRAETRIASGIFSVGHCAAVAARGVLSDLNGKALLVIGAGRIAEATAKHFAHQGAAPIVVANRTLERAQELAQRLGAAARSITALPELLADADLVITCTSAPHFVLDRGIVARAVAERSDRPLVIVDVGMPRDVDPEVAQLANVRLFNLDDLEPVVAENAKAREGEVEAARAIIAEEVRAFEGWQGRNEVVPLINSLRRRGEAVREQCLEQARRRLCHLAPEDAMAVERLADLIIKRLLHAPTAALREHRRDGGLTLAAAARELFDLWDEG